LFIFTTLLLHFPDDIYDLFIHSRTNKNAILCFENFGEPNLADWNLFLSFRLSTALTIQFEFVKLGREAHVSIFWIKEWALTVD
jgi:hypothetical protein